MSQKISTLCIDHPPHDRSRKTHQTFRQQACCGQPIIHRGKRRSPWIPRPNGAGKSTTMRMVTGFIPPTSGDAKVCGISITENPSAAKTKIGYLPESAPLYNDMTVIGFLKFCANIRKLSGSRKRDAVESAIETCFLGSVAHQSIDTLSKGYRHRTCLAQALLHDPEVLILDEPTDGLDPNQKYEVRQLIKRLGQDQSHPLLHPHTRGSRSSLHPRRHRRSRLHRSRRHPRRTNRPSPQRLPNRPLPQSHHHRHRRIKHNPSLPLITDH